MPSARSSAAHHGCGGDHHSRTGRRRTDVTTSQDGTILVDGEGRTLYLFVADQGSASVCTGDCATAWPPLIVTEKPNAGTEITAGEIGTTTRAAGTTQVTYYGHPRYYFAEDTAPTR
ncbi:hypothetical protein CC117_04835 [Parafrankia colletiae]|uniref:Lipoprotein n=1 Tax=Parafrankia colletiae TaxID=573497 RepID=A0A1S1QIA2_9ACTN|nr:hypothetical protein [Parafrankia colletiae]MCK9900409.1 hypothetical protein [Frankia sp. Cpl3]OHV33710.1 hypothetical protein CC117_04835 [Parafrankia colletiae]